MDTLSSKLVDERMTKLHEEIKELRAQQSYDPLEQFIRWKETADKVFPNRGGEPNIELEKLKLEQQLKLKEFEMKADERQEARMLADSLRQTLDTGISAIGGPMAEAVILTPLQELQELFQIHSKYSFHK